ncbi:MAG: BlaI/MecI/CopY family transcriptional regulator [Lachnospiraceae bacterium]|nr:BlaI/MecI/CopY family transcriptional regulator [Lachnospiraceae bacterium]
MQDYQMGTLETKFAEIIWDKEPITSTELSKVAEKEIGWKKSTTYTVLRRLCEKGIFVNKDSIVTSLLSKDEFYSAQSESFVNQTFKGSLPAFIAAFSSRKKLSENDVNEIQKMIDEYRQGGGNNE